MNKVQYVTRKNGWYHKLKGESGDLYTLQSAFEELNTAGYKVVLVTEGSWGFMKSLGNFLLWCVTLGAHWKSATMIVVGEKVGE